MKSKPQQQNPARDLARKPVVWRAGIWPSALCLGLWVAPGLVNSQVMSNPSVTELVDDLSGVGADRAFVHTAPPTRDGLCLGAQGASRPRASSGPSSPPSEGNTGRNLEAEPPYNPTAPHVDLLLNFKDDSDELESASLPLLNKLAQALKTPELVGRRLVVAGHTNAKGSAKHNLELSCARAIRVRNYLIGQQVDGARISAYGFGFDRPLPNVASVSEQNRRVEIHMEVKE